MPGRLPSSVSPGASRLAAAETFGPSGHGTGSQSVAADGALGDGEPSRCLSPNEIVEYLAPSESEPVLARVSRHIAACERCRGRVQHVDDEVLDYIEGRCSPAQLARIDLHLDDCVPCRELVHCVIGSLETSHPSASAADGSDWITTFAPRTVVNNRYVVRRFLGRGGMGEVYEAFDQLMGTRIALKTVLCTSADQPRSARQLKAEVLHAQRVGHPHVCRINELQEHRDDSSHWCVPFFTMEFIDGERLGERIRRSELALDEVQVIAVQLLEGLNAAHCRGVLHLDFKSDNVMLRSGGGPDAVIMDFGLSRVLDNEARLHTSERHQIAGTLPYMALEQLECKDDLGPAADVYAFGVVLYEMLTKTFPFRVSSLAGLLLEQLKERPSPPSLHRSGLSPALDRFVLECLSTDRRRRFADAGRALAALRAVGAWELEPKKARGRRKRWPVPWAIAACVAAVGTLASHTHGPLSVAAPVPLRGESGARVLQRTEGLSPGSTPGEPARIEPTSSAPPPAPPEVRRSPLQDRAVPAVQRESSGAVSAQSERSERPSRSGSRGAESRPSPSRSRPPSHATFPDLTAPAPSADPAVAGASSTAPGAPTPNEPGGWRPTRFPRQLAPPAAQEP